MIPIANIYYMLSYSAGILPEQGERFVTASNDEALVELFAQAFERRLTPVVKRGFYKEYVTTKQETTAPRGKILMRETMRLGHKPRVVSEVDHFSVDILHNQIIRATLVKLIHDGSLTRQTTTKLTRQLRYFQEITPIRVTAQHFENLTFHRQNQNDRMLLYICRMIHLYTMIDEVDGRLRFIDFEKTHRMHELFEQFVRNFYKQHLHDYQVSREYMDWHVGRVVKGDRSLIPKMQTDICLTNEARKIIIDTKYYEHTLMTTRYGAERVHSQNLYQLYSYLENAESRPMMAGMLLYPQVDEPIDLVVELNGYPLTVATVDLNVHWSVIHTRLMQLIERI